MRKMLDFLDKIIMFILVLVLCAMLISGTMQVVWRYVLKASLSWSEEFMRFLYVWATLLGVCCGIRRSSFAVIDSFLDFIGKKSPMAKKVMQFLGYAIQIMVFLLLIIYGWQFTMKGLTQRSPAMGMNMAIVYSALPIGGAFGLIATLESIYNSIFPLKEGRFDAPEN